MPTSRPTDQDSGGTFRWSLTAAGSFSIYDSERQRNATPRSRKARAILAYLSSRPGAHVSREKIAELLWGNRAEPQAKASLRQALLDIRRAAPGQPSLICSDRGHLWINEAAVEVIFDTSTNGGGDFMPFEDLDHISAEFDHWLEIERSRRSREAAAELRREAEEKLEAGEAGSALEIIESAWRFDPYDEDALRLALQAEYQAGHAAAIEQRFQAMVDLLRNDLGVEPAAETRTLHDRLVAELRNRKESASSPDDDDRQVEQAREGALSPPER